MSAPTTFEEFSPSAIAVEVSEGIAQVTLNRPAVHNAFDATMIDELATTWALCRAEDAVRAIVLTGAGEKAFSTGIDRSQVEWGFDPLNYEDPGKRLGPKSQGLWKPVVAAVNGMACGGAFYLLGEADVILAADHATFFDPHVTYGMVAAFEPILMLRKLPFGEVVRMSLAGTHERVSAATAQRIGLVSEVFEGSALLGEARALAATFAAQAPLAVQATLRTLWAAKDLPGGQAIDLGNLFLQLGTSIDALEAGQQTFASGARVEPKIR